MILQKTKPKAMCKLRTASVVLNPEERLFLEKSKGEEEKVVGFDRNPDKYILKLTTSCEVVCTWNRSKKDGIKMKEDLTVLMAVKSFSVGKKIKFRG